ncbi:outer membrane transport energization protein ExbD [[Leptolyngbya] sp. PCC 7376]|uniref:ExbD/TolR family protein n=1 Tax=[Leptolyngbya] sp. PCC 7376 TaxID=111781 RepID=UPI00029EF320|nr:biopolymer transporter ExbD [[Leptolyngbya] sp. PCC 7376]AFY38235.1 outer membrane transport energization protein ExbD [[Leptolyngbya] sp. PCC 7376]
MRRHAIDEPDLPPQINIVPMIDVIFAILTFFIISTLFLGRFEALTVNLPKAKTSQSQDSVKATVTLDEAGIVYLNKSEVSLDDLKDEITDLVESETNLVVVLNADGAVTHDKVVTVIDQVRQIEGAKLAIATKSKAD